MTRPTPALQADEIAQLRAIHQAMCARRPEGDRRQIDYAYAVEDLILGLVSVGGGEILRANDVLEPAQRLRKLALKS